MGLLADEKQGVEVLNCQRGATGRFPSSSLIIKETPGYEEISGEMTRMGE